jgi:hypothetical protein
MGVVLLAEDLRLGRRAAVKVMLPELAEGRDCRERFMREARAAAAVDNDHVVPIYEVGEDRGVAYLAMPLLRGETLEARLRRDGALPARDVLRVGREAALGLAAAHEQGLIHRDIKPANIFLEDRAARGAGEARDGPRSAAPASAAGPPRVKVLDFGLARAAAGGAEVTRLGSVLGTPSYMAPEQADGAPVDGRCDLFSLGCVLYRASTGASPFERPGVTATLMAVAAHDPPRPVDLTPGLPPGLSALIMALLAKDPGGRPASALEVAARLAELEATEPAGEPGDPPPRRRRRAVLSAAAWAGGALLALAGGVVYLTSDTGTPRGTAGARVTARPAAAPVTAEETPPADPIRQAYSDLRDAETRLGQPNGEEQRGTEGARYRPYEYGEIILPPGSPRAFAIYGPVYGAYRAIDGRGVKMGQPSGGIEYRADGGSFMTFKNGLIVLPPGSRSAHAFYGPFYEAYNSTPNAGGAFGDPQSGIQGGYQGATYVAFERGQIILPPGSRTAYALYGPFYEAYRKVQNHGAAFSHPTGGVQPGSSGARHMSFERGEIILPPGSAVARCVYGPFYQAYSRLGNTASMLGHPVSDIYVDGGTRRIDFEHGSMRWGGGEEVQVRLE